MKIKVKTNKKKTLTKQNVSADRRNEVYKDLQSKSNTSNLVKFYMRNKNLNMNKILPYRLTMEIKKKEEVVNPYAYMYKKKKAFKQLILLRQILNTIKRLWYLMKAYKKINRVISTWHKKMIEHELYQFKKIIEKIENTKDVIHIYRQLQQRKKKYNDVITSYYRRATTQFLKSIIKYQKQWNKNIIRTHMVNYEKYRKILSLLFFLKKKLFNQLKNGNLAQIKYWKDIIKITLKRCKLRNVAPFMHHYVMHEQKTYQNVEDISTSLRPFIFFYLFTKLVQKSRNEILTHTKRSYYKLLISFLKHSKGYPYKKKMTTVLKKKNQIKKKAKQYFLLLNMYWDIFKKVRYQLRSNIMRRRIYMVNERINYMTQPPLIQPITKQLLMNQIMKKRLSIFLMLFKHSKYIPIDKYLKLKKKWTRNHRKKKIHYTQFKKWYTKLQQEQKQKQNKKKKKLLITNTKRYINLKRRSVVLKLKSIKQSKKKTVKTGKYMKRKQKKQWKKKTYQLSKKSPYRITCFLQLDFFSSWVNDYSIKNVYKKKKKDNRVDYYTKLIKEWKFKSQRRRYKSIRIVPTSITFTKQQILLERIKQTFSV